METRQPLLHDRLACVRAPMHAWSGPDGDMICGVDGVYLADVRLVSQCRLGVQSHQIEHLSSCATGAGDLRVESTLRFDDQPTTDPLFRVVRRRHLGPEHCVETVEFTNLTERPRHLVVTVDLESDLAPIHLVRSGHTRRRSA